MNVRKLRRSRLATLATLAAALTLSCGQANASFTNFSFSSSFGVFSQPESIAVDESTGDIYVYNREDNSGIIRIEKFDADGNPADFSALATNAIVSQGIRENQVAVDNSSGPASGDIYVANGSGVQIYGMDGKELGELGEATGTPWGEPCGVAVDRAGNVYVGLYDEHVNKYTPNANPVTNSDYAGSITQFSRICKVGVDVGGDVYGAKPSQGPLIEYDPSQFGASQPNGTGLAAEGDVFAVANSLSRELFVNHQEEIVQYDASGNPLSTFGAHVVGIGFNAKNGRLYLSNGVSKMVEIWQGAVALPSLETSQATNLSVAGSATLNGVVEPEENPVGTCAFEYGTSIAYDSLISCEQETPLTGGGTLAVSASLPTVLLNNVYHYRLAAGNGNGTADGADKTFIILVPPTVGDQAPTASSVTRASAKLTATINPEQADTSYHFDIGITENYGNSTPLAHTGAGILNDTTVVQRVGELLPDTTYHYRLVASNVAGRVVGVDHTFKTGAATLPVATTEAASGIAENSATISGVVDTNDLPTSYGFEVDTSTDYGPRTGLGSVGAGESEAQVSLSLTGLLPGTTYHYRLTATNVDGTSYGVDRTFTTSVFADTFAIPPAPLPFVTVPSIAFPTEAKPVVKKKGKAKSKKIKKHRKAKAKGKKKAKHKKKK